MGVYPSHPHHPHVEGRSSGAGSNASLFFGIVVATDSTLPIPPAFRKSAREVFDFSVMGRLKPGWDVTRASGYWLDQPRLFESTAPTLRRKGSQLFKGFRLGAYPAGEGERTARRL